MTEIKINDPIQKIDDFNQLDLLFKIHRLKKIRKKLSSKLNSIEKLLKSDDQKKFKQKFQVLKVVMAENSEKYRNATSQVNNWNNVFTLSKLLEENNQYIVNLKNERNKGHLDSESYELTKGHYLQKIIDIKSNFNNLKSLARSYFHELKEEIINLEDERIRLITEKAKKTITKKDFKDQLMENDNSKHVLEEKLAFLQVKIIDYQLE